MNELDFNELDRMIDAAFAEDIKTGDITTEATIPPHLQGRGVFLIKEDGVIAGFEVLKRIINRYDESLKLEIKLKDGEKVTKGTVGAVVVGKASSILTVERTALNFLQRISGIATAVTEYSSLISHTKAKIIDTRKTVPGLRMIDKLAVSLSGNRNHRIGLYDMFLIKDNHIAVSGGITKAVEACREYKRQNNLSAMIEVETTNLDEVNEALAAGADIIMLDNFELNDMKKAVEFINGRCKVEASGGINLTTVKAVAETGVDFISVGAVTHSVKALDISLDVTII